MGKNKLQREDKMIYTHRIYPVILSGGGGVRLWPLSRGLHPKQFLNLACTDAVKSEKSRQSEQSKQSEKVEQSEHSLLQQTLLRVNDSNRFHKPIVISNVEHRFLVAEQARALGMDLDIILEPVARNTAPAITVVALKLLTMDPLAVMLVLPSDHMMSNLQQFLDKLECGLAAVNEGNLVTFGVSPTKPETGFGYIQKGEAIIDEAYKIYNVKAFVEKPDIDTANQYLKSGDYLWNCGIFLFSANQYLLELKELHPDVIEACQESLANATQDLDFLRLEIVSFSRSLNQSIDYALMEKAKKVAVVPIEGGWSDVGSWEAVWEQGTKDEHGNVLRGDVIVQNVRESYVHSEGPLVTVMGLDNVVVVAMPDAVLVMSRASNQNVKDLTNVLRLQNRSELDTHPKVLRPWGSYQIVDVDNQWKVKRLVVKPGGILSLQKHEHRSEHWVVLNGIGKVTRDHEILWLRENESIDIPAGAIHRLENTTELDLVLIEVQTGHYLGEDDIIRLEDVYGRLKTKTGVEYV